MTYGAKSPIYLYSKATTQKCSILELYELSPQHLNQSTFKQTDLRFDLIKSRLIWQILYLPICCCHRYTLLMDLWSGPAYGQNTHYYHHYYYIEGKMCLLKMTFPVLVNCKYRKRNEVSHLFVQYSKPSAQTYGICVLYALRL